MFLWTFSNSVQLRHVRLFATPWITARQASLSITNSWSPPKLMSIESMMPSNHLILCRLLLLLPSIFPNSRVFSNESAVCMRWPKYWSFSFNIGSSNEHPGLTSFRMDWLDLLAVQGTLKSLLQHTVQKHQFSSFLLNLSLLQRYICMYIFSPGKSHKKCIKNVLPWGGKNDLKKTFLVKLKYYIFK